MSGLLVEPAWAIAAAEPEAPYSNWPRTLFSAWPRSPKVSGRPPPVDTGRPTDLVTQAATRASREQIELAQQAAAIERRLRVDPSAVNDLTRLLSFVAQVRLSAARTGGDLTEILLFQQQLAQTGGASRPMPAQRRDEPE